MLEQVATKMGSNNFIVFFVPKLFHKPVFKYFYLTFFFLKWIQILIKNQESCVNVGITTKFFSLDREDHQGHPISAFLFTLA